MRRLQGKYLFLLLCAAFFLANTHIHAAGLIFPGHSLVVPDDYQADPGELVSYFFLLTNNTNGSTMFHVAFSSEADWPLLGEAGDITVGAGEEVIIPITVIVPPDAPAGAKNRLELVLTWTNGQEAARSSVTTTVKTRYAFDLTAPASAGGNPGDLVEVAFTITNQGNIPDEYNLSISAPGGWTARPDGGTYTVAAGSSRTIPVAIGIPADAPPNTSVVVTVAATSKATGRVRTAKTVVKAGAAGASAVVGPDSYQLYGELGLSLSEPTGYDGPLNTWLRLTNPIDPGKRWDLRLNIEDTAAGFGLADSFFLYETRNFRLKLGDITSPWTGMIYPGTGVAGFDAFYRTGRSELQLTIGTPSSAYIILDPLWYGLTWSYSPIPWDLTLRLLRTEEGTNASDQPYLDLSIGRRRSGFSLLANLAYTPEAGSPPAWSVVCQQNPSPLGWEAGVSWYDGINRENRMFSLSGGIVYQWSAGNNARLDLSFLDETALAGSDPLVPDIPPTRTYQARGTVSLDSGLDGYLTVKNIWTEEPAWAPAGLDWLLGMSYAAPDRAIPFETAVELKSTLPTAGDASYALKLTGACDFALSNVPGVWRAVADASISLVSGPLQLDKAGLSLNYQSSPANDLNWQATVSLTSGAAIPAALTIDGQLDWYFNDDARLTAKGRLSYNFPDAMADLAIGAQLVYWFGWQLPRPHTTLNGLVFQDLDGNGLYDEDEPGVAGVFILYDGKRVAQTGPDGRWSLSGVAPGDHWISMDCEIDPTLHGRAERIDFIAEAGRVLDLAIPLQRLTALSGRVLLDSDGDGESTSADRPLQGWPVVLGRPDGTEATSITGADGSYFFPNLTPGVYTLRIAGENQMQIEDLVLPEPVEVVIGQQEALTRDLLVTYRIKDVIITFGDAPQMQALVCPGEAAPVIPAGLPAGPLTVTITGWGDGDEPGTVTATVASPSES